MPKTIIELSHVSYCYRMHEALSNINLQVYQGERVAIVGANGSGKSTLLKIIDGLIFPTSGKVKIFGKTCDENSFNDANFRKEFRAKVGFVFQDSDIQLISPTVLEEIAFAPLQLNLPEEEVRERVQAALKKLGIAHLSERSPFELSGGEKKKVALASVLSLSPQIWLLDEPTNNLDPKSVGNFLDFMFDLSQKNNTIIISTNNLSIIREIADKVVVLSEKHSISGVGESGKILKDRKLLEENNLIHTHTHKHPKTIHRHIHEH